MSLVTDKVKAVVQWDEATPEEWENGIRIVLNHFKEIKQVKNNFHFSTICFLFIKINVFILHHYIEGAKIESYLCILF